MFSFLKFNPSKTTKIISYILVIATLVFAKVFNYLDTLPASNSFENLVLNYSSDLLDEKPQVLHSVQVQRVVDGDTFIDSNNNSYRIAFIDAPEISQSFGVEASDFLKALIENQECLIENLSTDKYERTVAKVYLGGVDIAHVLVEYGYAWNQANAYNADKDYAEKLDELENSAKLNKKGLWALSDNILPFEFRSKAGKSD